MEGTIGVLMTSHLLVGSTCTYVCSEMCYPFFVQLEESEWDRNGEDMKHTMQTFNNEKWLITLFA